MGGKRSNSNPYNHHPIADDGIVERLVAALAALASSIGRDGGEAGTDLDRLQGAMARLLSTATAPAPASRQRHDRRGYSVADLLRLYPVGKTKIYAEIKAGRLRPTKIGRRTMFTAEAVDDWLSTLEQKSAAKRNTAMDTPKAVAAEGV
jgi:excisionase family DNA binding protein